MADRKTVMSWLEGLAQDDWREWHSDSEVQITVQAALDLLKERSEIVRCKDCKHLCDYTDIFPDHAYKCIKNGGYHNDSWFCADGERKQEKYE